MSPTSSESTILAVIRRGIVNVIYFISSIAGVVGIIIHGEEVSKLEFAGTLIVVSACYIILYFFLLQFRNEILKIPRKTLFILITILLFLLITKAAASFVYCFNGNTYLLRALHGHMADERRKF